MVSSALWVIGPALESALLVRAAYAGLIRRYRFFYLYIGWVLLRDVALVPIHHYVRPEIYQDVFWYTEFCCVLIGCGVVLDIYRTALSLYGGAARMARNILLFIFVFTTSRILVKAWNNPKWFPGNTTLETERDLRIVQVAVLIGLAALLAYYAIPIGRNIRGMIIGYGVFLGMSLINLSARDYLGAGFQQAWSDLQATSYVAVLLIWVRTLWSYAPAPKTDHGAQLETDYESLLSATKRQVADMWAHMSGSARS